MFIGERLSHAELRWFDIDTSVSCVVNGYIYTGKTKFVLKSHLKDGIVCKKYAVNCLYL